VDEKKKKYLKLKLNRHAMNKKITNLNETILLKVKKNKKIFFFQKKKKKQTSKIAKGSKDGRE